MIRIGNISVLPQVFGALGLNFEAAVRRIGTSPAVFDQPESLVPYRVLDELLTIAREEAGCEHAGLLVGMAPPNLGLPGFVAMQAPTVRQGLADLMSSLTLSDTGGVASLDQHGNVAVINYSIIAQGLRNADLVYDGAIAIGYGLLAMLTGEPEAISEVRLVRRRPADPEPFRAFFVASRIVYGAHVGALEFDASILDRPVPNANPALYRYLKALLESRTRAELPASLVDQIRHLLPLLMRHDEVTSRKVAQLLGVTPRTLSRRLSENATTLREIISQARLKSGMQLLRNTDLSLNEIAESLAYSDASAFSRAFKAKHGLTPGEWRKRDRGDNGDRRDHDGL